MSLRLELSPWLIEKLDAVGMLTVSCGLTVTEALDELAMFGFFLLSIT